ncbi:MAG: aminodeoxychorismate synthase component I [Gammaproteobacteria bacterium]|nr:aminodeoxychorismate synthase component I [Gammaproteobacteria bacterium]
MSVVELEYFGDRTADLYFSKVRSLKYSLLLTGNQDADGSQHDIILAAPSAVVVSHSSPQVQHHRLDFNQSDWISGLPLQEKPLNLLSPKSQINEWLTHYQLPSEITKTYDDQHSESTEVTSLKNLVEHLPFIGGVAGAFSYDFGRQLENIPLLSENDLKLPDLVAGVYFCPLVVDHKAKKTYLLNLFKKDELADWLEKQYYKDEIKQESNKDPKLASDWTSNMTQDDYSKKFATVKTYIKNGDCYQINLAQRFKAEYHGDAWQTFQFLHKLNQSPFSGFFNLGDAEILSFSPERFIRIEGDHITTQPIKGTRPRGSSEHEDQQHANELQNSEKDKAENLMIVDLLRNDIGRSAAPGSVKVSELFGLYSFNSVHHLISTIEAKLSNDKTAFDVFISAFPGGSITGAPKVRAMEIIEELEPHRRSFYCGSLAYFSFNNKSDSNIMIRTLVSHDNALYAWAGGGLVDDSNCTDEYNETFSKLSKILTPLQYEKLD